jgi:hypothetical protein
MGVSPPVGSTAAVGAGGKVVAAGACGAPLQPISKISSAINRAYGFIRIILDAGAARANATRRTHKRPIVARLDGCPMRIFTDISPLETEFLLGNSVSKGENLRNLRNLRNLWFLLLPLNLAEPAP